MGGLPPSPLQERNFVVFFCKKRVNKTSFFFFFFVEIQDGSQNFIPKINAFLHFMQKLKMAAKNGSKEIFVKCRQYTLQIPCVTNFIKIAVSQTVFKINAFLRFPQKFKMAAKNGGKMIFVKSRQYTLQITCRSEIFSKSLS